MAAPPRRLNESAAEYGRRVTTGADRRPRIHLTRTAAGASFSFGPCGNPVAARTVGEAVDMALGAIGNQPAVIIYDPGVEHRAVPS